MTGVKCLNIKNILVLSPKLDAFSEIMKIKVLSKYDLLRKDTLYKVFYILTLTQKKNLKVGVIVIFLFNGV